jgi:acetyl-CoA carboxylase biotin carboxylase subunit
VHRLSFPTGEGIRVETHLREGDTIPPNYDSMVAKLVVHAENCPAAIARMEAALSATHIEGVPTTIALHRKILADPRFLSGDYDTRFLGL